MKVLILAFVSCACAAFISSAVNRPGEVVLSATSAVTLKTAPPVEEAPVLNANHIFNAIRGALRQWDSSWNHNGMSFFLADVPEGIQLYHGTSQEEAVTGMEWLAFEPEHALMFAVGRVYYVLDVNKTSSGPYLDRKAVESSPPRAKSQRATPAIITPGASTGARCSAYTRIAATTFVLFETGKTLRGTLDSQDNVLLSHLNGTLRGPMDEWKRAEGLCNLTRDQWDDRVDGFIRVETGFEIILCHFEKHLQLEQAQIVERDNDTQHHHIFDSFRLFRAIADRYRGIGGGRASINHANIATAFSHNLDLWSGDPIVPGEKLPRIQNVSTVTLAPLREQISRMVMHPAAKGVNWQDIADLFVQRYAGPLQYLAQDHVLDDDFRDELEALLVIFMSDKTNSKATITSRCMSQFLPPAATWRTSLAGRTVYNVSSTLCRTLATTINLISPYKPSHPSTAEAAAAAHKTAKSLIANLTTYLDWPIFHECTPSCKLGEVCVIPIWPLTSSIEDRKNPNCKNRKEFMKELLGGRLGKRDYWFSEDEVERPSNETAFMA